MRYKKLKHYNLSTIQKKAHKPMLVDSIHISSQLFSASQAAHRRKSPEMLVPAGSHALCIGSGVTGNDKRLVDIPSHSR